MDHRYVAVAPKADGSPGYTPEPWEAGTLLEVNRHAGDHMESFWPVPHVDGAPLPEACCAPKAPPPGCPYCCVACQSATGGQCRDHVEPECTCTELTGGHMPGCPMYRTH
ncbi:MAG TPA: hypothetical protein VGI39_04815 [Polyangiaceae bacterium]